MRRSAARCGDRAPLAVPMIIDAFAVELERIAIRSDGPVELSLADEVVTMKRLTLASEDTNLTLGGTLDFKGQRPLDVYAKGHLNLALFHALDDEDHQLRIDRGRRNGQRHDGQADHEWPGGDCARRILADRSAGRLG